MIKNNELLGFSERRFNEYLAQKILKDIKNWKSIDVIKFSYFNKLNLIDFPSILCLFYNLVNKSLQENLVELILLSRSSKEIDLACSNAATILARSDFIFKDIDFSRIRIPKADLSQCLFVDLNFEGSYLKEVNFVQSQFQNVNFKNCDLSCANFGYFKKFKSDWGKGLNFSSDDKYFWYKIDENFIEIDLISEKIINKFSIIDFITTNISRIHSLRYRPSSTTTNKDNIKLWNNYDKSTIYDINIHEVAISTNLKYIAALDAKSSVLSWDLEKNKQILGTFKPFIYKGRKLIFSPTDRYLLIIRAKTISLIETENWTLLRDIWGNFNIKNVFTSSYCGKKIAFFDNSYLFLLNTWTSSKIKLSPIDKKLWCLSFSPCGKFLAYGIREENYGYIIDIKLRQIFQIFPNFESYPESVTFSTSGKYISWCDSIGNFRIYEFSPKFVPNDNKRHLQIYLSKLSPKGTYLMTLSREKSILWDLNNFQPKQRKQFTSDFNNYFYVSDIIFSPHETYLLRKLCNKVEIYDIKRDIKIRALDRGRFWYDNYSFSHCENYLIMLNKRSYLYFNIPNFLVLRKINIQSPSLAHIKFSGCGNYDFWYDPQNNIYIWDLVIGDCIKKIQFEGGHNVYATTFLLSKIAFYVTREEKYYIYVLDIESGIVVKTPIEGEYFFGVCFAGCNEALLVEGPLKGFRKIRDIKKKSVKKRFRSLLSRNIGLIEVVSNYFIIKENDNAEILNLDELDY